jgi:ABC-2 type transport system ATP-binding protein
MSARESAQRVRRSGPATRVDRPARAPGLSEERTQYAVEVTGLRKSYRPTLVLDGIDLAVPEGSVFALLGPNGAGKTTTVEILSTLIPADAGAVRVAGHDVAAEPDAVRAAIGVTGQFSAVDGFLTGRENLLLMADLLHLGRAAGRRTADELLERFELTEAAGRPASTYSGGMKRRLDLAMTLVASPRVIFLDEPTIGLDPRSRRTMWQVVRELVAGGITVVLTTQYLDEADELADRVAVLDAGRIVAAGTPEELKRRVPGGHVRLWFADLPALDAASAAVRGADRDDQSLSLTVPGNGSVSSLRALLDQLDRAEVEVDDLAIHTPDLDDVFFAVTGTRKGGQE